MTSIFDGNLSIPPSLPNPVTHGAQAAGTQSKPAENPPTFLGMPWDSTFLKAITKPPAASPAPPPPPVAPALLLIEGTVPENLISNPEQTGWTA